MNKNGNMVTGNPAKVLILFAIPMIVGNLFQQFYNIADSIIVGRMINSDALAAVGASNAISMLFVMVAIGTGIGCSVLISQYYGAGDMESTKSCISTAIKAILVFSIVLSAAGYFCSEAVLRAMGTPSRNFDDAAVYLKIYFLGFAFLFMYNVFNAIFNALGDSKKPLIFLIISSLLNIGLDILFIGAFNMGVAGAAWATLIAQGVSAVTSFVVLIKKIRSLKSDAYPSFSGSHLKNMVTIAIPTVIQQSIISIGMLLIQAVVNRFGSDFMAGYTAAIKIDSIVIVPMVNVGNAVSTFVSQNMGAGKPNRAKEGYRVGAIVAASMGVIFGIVLNIFAKGLIGMFMDSKESQDAINVGVQYLKINSIAYFVMGLMNVTSAVLRGAGDKKWFLVQCLANLVTRVILIYSLAGITDGVVIMWGSGVGWFIGYLISFIRYRQGGWQDICVIRR